jgi:hypothetical protein
MHIECNARSGPFISSLWTIELKEIEVRGMVAGGGAAVRLLNNHLEWHCTQTYYSAA